MRHAPVWRAVWVAALVSVFCLPGQGLAHRVNVFAYIEGDTVHVECSYSKSDRVRFGDIEVKNPASGKVYLSGKTDEKGNFVFKVPAEARAAKADLQILLRAGEGHQNDWLVKADEYLTAAPAPAANQPSTAAPAPPTAAEKSLNPAASSPVGPVASKAAQAPALDAASLQALVSTAVDTAMEKKIAPLRRMLLDAQEKGPGVHEILGGIGYLVGIAGLLAYVRSRKERPGS